MPYRLHERTDALRNPYRGMYTIFRVHADAPLDVAEQINGTDLNSIAADQTLVLLEVNLHHFREGDLSEGALSNIEDTFKFFENRQLQLILRFVYDWEGQGAMHEPSSISIILRHMEQLSPLLKRYSGLIYILQGLFIGSWGEMHNTRYSGISDLTLLAGTLASCSAPETFIALRCPWHWRVIFKTYSPLSYSDLLHAVPQARFCLFNDAIMGSETDMGTYGTLPRSASVSLTDKLCRYDELAFQQMLCRYVPNGGEVLKNSPLNDVKPALKTMAAMHLSYLNSSYDRNVLDKWRRSSSALSKIFRGHSDFDYIAAHLGYRYVLADSRLTRDRYSPDIAQLHLTIINNGFSACYRPLDVSLVLRHKESGDQLILPIDTDIRNWQPQQRCELLLALAEKSIQQGRYQAGLQLRCSLTGREVRLANQPDHQDRFDMTNPIGELLL